MKYEAPKPIERDRAEVALDVGSVDQAARALISVALFDPDWNWAESFCLRAIPDMREDVRRAAITGLGHVARIHHMISRRAFETLVELQSDPVVGGTAEDALDDVSGGATEIGA